jgi:hypothetical protein
MSYAAAAARMLLNWPFLYALTARLTLSSNMRADSSCFDAMLDGKIDSVIGRFRGGRSGPLGVVARSVSDYVNKIFTSYDVFKKRLENTFSDINKERNAERQL